MSLLNQQFEMKNRKLGSEILDYDINSNNIRIFTKRIFLEVKNPFGNVDLYYPTLIMDLMLRYELGVN